MLVDTLSGIVHEEKKIKSSRSYSGGANQDKAKGGAKKGYDCGRMVSEGGDRQYAGYGLYCRCPKIPLKWTCDNHCDCKSNTCYWNYAGTNRECCRRNQWSSTPFW